MRRTYRGVGQCETAPKEPFPTIRLRHRFNGDSLARLLAGAIHKLDVGPTAFGRPTAKQRKWIAILTVVNAHALMVRALPLTTWSTSYLSLMASFGHSEFLTQYCFHWLCLFGQRVSTSTRSRFFDSLNVQVCLSAFCREICSNLERELKNRAPFKLLGEFLVVEECQEILERSHSKVSIGVLWIGFCRITAILTSIVNGVLTFNRAADEKFYMYFSTLCYEHI
jgi:hypothetical protein